MPGATEAEVASQLTAIVEDLATDVIDGKMPVPEVPGGKTYSGKFLVHVPPALHRRVALQAMARGESLNQYVAEVLAHAGA